MAFLDFARNFVDDQLPHAVNTLTLGAVDNRDEVRVEYDTWGNVLPITRMENDDGTFSNYATDRNVGNGFAAAATSMAMATTYSAGVRMGSFATNNGTRMATIEAMSGMQKAGRYGLMAAITGMGAIGLGGSLYSMFMSGSQINNNLAHADIPVISTIATNMATPYVEPELFDEELTEEAAAEAAEIAELEDAGLILEEED